MQLSKTLKVLNYRSTAASLIWLAAAAIPVPALAAGAVPKEAGVWIDDTGKGAVRIEPCGAKLCGKIVWLREPLNTKGEALTDKHNPDASKQKRSICGLATLGDLQAMTEGGFDGGWVYDPKDGKSYTVALDLKGPNKLQVTGYLGVRFLGKSFIWTRATDELPSCTVTPAATQVIPPASAPGLAKGIEKQPGAKPAGDKQAGEVLPWGDQKSKAAETVKPAPAAKIAPVKTAPADAAKVGAPKPGAKSVPPATKASVQPPAKTVIQQRPAAAVSN